METESGEGGTNFLDLPEGCIANILSFTSPPDACRLSLVSSTFKNAAQSDTVWEKFLPPDFNSIISQSSYSSLLNRFSSKKQLYFNLCDSPILIDDSKKSFSLEKWTGNKCYMLSARDLMIAWGDTPDYWKWSSDYPDSRFEHVAELIRVYWLEIRGKISTHMLSNATSYKAYLIFKSSTDGIYFGFGFPPAEVTVGLSGNESCKRSVFLVVDKARRRRFRRSRIGLFNSWRFYRLQGTSDEYYPKERGDGWFEIELGEFFNEDGEDGEDGDLEISVMEVEGGHFKCGLVVQGIEIRPREK